MTSKINEGATGAIQEELLAKAANKPVRRLYQIDYFSPGTGAIDWRSLGVEEPDHELFDVGWVDELRLSDCLRVQIPEHFTKERALAALRTIADVFEHKIEMGDPADAANNGNSPTIREETKL
ncbi:MAG: hypothetical protein KF753_18345 [Caldilineaceae bacterium]|nr:hypothetical protein [Caldilineaceae bacterium]